MAYSNRKIMVSLDTEAEEQVVLWASRYIDGYLENLQDDQNCCYICAGNDYMHAGHESYNPDQARREGLECMLVSDHKFTSEWPMFRAEVIGHNLIVALEPNMVLSYLTDTVLLGDFENLDKEDWEAEFGTEKPSVDVARTLWARICEEERHG
jgi:hypothetical protein